MVNFTGKRMPDVLMLLLITSSYHMMHKNTTNAYSLTGCFVTDRVIDHVVDLIRPLKTLTVLFITG